MTDKLNRCPCGETPTALDIIDTSQGGKWANAAPDCCGSWEIEFKTQYNELDSIECIELAIKSWNQAPRFFNE